MGRPALLPEEISEFRERLCEAALRLFAEHGYDGFTMRALGEAVGCSPTTPYRYFASKAEIFDGLCARAFSDLCDAQEVARASASSPWDGIRGQGRAYVDFARSHPHAYRVMFDLRGPPGDGPPSAASLESIARSWDLLVGAFDAAREAGQLDGDPERLAVSFWASHHGVVSLELAERIFVDVTADALADDVFAHFERAYARHPERTGDPS